MEDRSDYECCWLNFKCPIELKIYSLKLIFFYNQFPFSWARSQNPENRLSASSCLYVRPSVRMEQLGSHWKDFYEILY